MPFRDHYKILEIGPGASQQEIKKAYRKLAHQYHPDKNQDNHFAASYFRDIQEAYHILSDDRRRAMYDEERWLAGYSLKKQPAAVTPEWLRQQALTLSRHMNTVDTYRMNQGALREYILLLLSDAHIAILQQANNAEVNEQIVTELIHATRGLSYPFFAAIVPALSELVKEHNELQQSLQALLQERRARYTWERYKPFVITVAAVALCILMYLFARYSR